MSRINCVGIALFLALFAAPSFAQIRADLSAEAVRADFRQLYSQMRESHFDLFARRSQADYDQEYSRVLATLTAPLTPVAARVRFQQFLAFGRIAHANIDFPSDAFTAFREAGGKTIPLFPRLEGDVVRVGDLYSGNPDILPGDQILALDGLDIRDWIARLSEHVSADNAYMAATMIETRFPALFWLEAGPQTALS